MAQIDFQPQRPHELLAVFEDESTAKQVVSDLNDQLSVGDARQGVREDRLKSLNAEMGEEVRHSFVAPQAAAIYTKETMKTGSWMMPLCLLAGVVVTMPVAFAIRGELSSGHRLLAGIVIGLLGGGTVALVLVALGQKKPNEPMAAERGVVVRVPQDGEEVRELLLAAHPIRVDVVDDRGRPIETIFTEPDETLQADTFNERRKENS